MSNVLLYGIVIMVTTEKRAKFVNANDAILNRPTTAVKQRFMKMSEEAAQKSRIAHMGQSMKLANLGLGGFAFGLGRPMTGGGDEFGESGSKKLRMTLHSLVSQLNAKGRMLSGPVMAKFESKLTALEELEKEIKTFIDEFRLFNARSASNGTGDVNEDEMKAAKAKYETASKDWIKKTLIVQSGLSSMEFKVKQIGPEVKGDEPVDHSFTL